MSMALAAADLGIGSSHAAVADQDLARSLLGFPEDRFAVSLLSLGYPRRSAARRRSGGPTGARSTRSCTAAAGSGRQQSGGSGSSAGRRLALLGRLLSHSSGPLAPARASSSLSVARSSALSAASISSSTASSARSTLEQHALALGGELDDAAAAVGAVAPAHDQAGVLELVEQRHEVGGVETERLDQRLLRRRARGPRGA